jgi:Asp-tRNA(Asn)/Glu-tRNA(Gln) amidotransferase C subunit
MRRLLRPALTRPSPSRATPHLPRPQLRTLASKTPEDLLSKPTWSVASLLDSQSPSAPQHTLSPDEEITPKKLHHLLRLSALPLPPTPEAEASLLASLRSHLRFVREIQAVDTTGVEPLRALRDETSRGREETTVRLADLKDALARETRFGHRQRPRRVKTTEGREDKVAAEAENWDPLKTAGRTAADKYFVVQNKKQS